MDFWKELRKTDKKMKEELDPKNKTERVKNIISKHEEQKKEECQSPATKKRVKK